MSSSAIEPVEIEYPESDGKPVGETGVHIDVTTLGLMDVIRRFYGPNAIVAVHSNLFVYFVEGDPKRIDPALDPFNPANGFDANGGSRYSPEFRTKYYEAQAARMNRLIAGASAAASQRYGSG